MTALSTADNNAAYESPQYEQAMEEFVHYCFPSQEEGQTGGDSPGIGGGILSQIGQTLGALGRGLSLGGGGLPQMIGPGGLLPSQEGGDPEAMSQESPFPTPLPTGLELPEEFRELPLIGPGGLLPSQQVGEPSPYPASLPTGLELPEQWRAPQ